MTSLPSSRRSRLIALGVIVALGMGFWLAGRYRRPLPAPPPPGPTLAEAAASAAASIQDMRRRLDAPPPD